jgi:hypothetical protein
MSDHLKIVRSKYDRELIDRYVRTNKTERSNYIPLDLDDMSEEVAYILSHWEPDAPLRDKLLRIWELKHLPEATPDDAV